jgi:hypothetical protein
MKGVTAMGGDFGLLNLPTGEAGFSVFADHCSFKGGENAIRNSTTGVYFFIADAANSKAGWNLFQALRSASTAMTATTVRLPALAWCLNSFNSTTYRLTAFAWSRTMV